MHVNLKTQKWTNDNILHPLTGLGGILNKLTFNVIWSPSLSWLTCVVTFIQSCSHILTNLCVFLMLMLRVILFSILVNNVTFRPVKNSVLIDSFSISPTLLLISHCQHLEVCLVLKGNQALSPKTTARWSFTQNSTEDEGAAKVSRSTDVPLSVL